MTSSSVADRIGILFPGDPRAPAPAPTNTRFHRIFEEFEARSVVAQALPYSDAARADVRERAMQLDALLVWVDPLANGSDRHELDGVLREIASEGVFVSAHPQVILTIGTKEVLYRTRDLPWGTDTRLYRSPEEVLAGLRTLHREAGPRVLKQHRGNGGDGVWKVEVARADPSDTIETVYVQHALRGAHVEELPLERFVAQCEAYFAQSGCMVDQPYAERLGEGMIRCYLVHDRVAGFGHQFVTALMPPLPGEAGPPDPPPRLYYGPEQAEFQTLRSRLESGWIAEMQRFLEIDREALPVIWDADFLLGPKAASGDDTCILCEINVSSVFPIPEEAVVPLVEATIERVRASRSARFA